MNESDGTAAEAYKDRNLAVQAFAAFAARAGGKVGLRDRDSEWPILVVEVEGMQVSWHLPKADVVIAWPDFDGEWDGHDLAEKRLRLQTLIFCGVPVDLLDPPEAPSTFQTDRPGQDAGRPRDRGAPP